MGTFPYRLKMGDGESAQLAWLRANASYMSAGLVGYLSAIGLLARGIIVNLLVTIPVLIALALGVAAVSISGWGFGVALTLALVVLVWVVVSPVMSRFRQVAMVRTTVKIGNESSVGSRIRNERAFGVLILLLGLAAAAEASSYFLDDFHFWTRERGLGFRDLASIGAVVLPLFAIAGRVLPKLAGTRRKLALAVTGVLSIVLPVLTVLLIADYLVFDVPGQTATRYVLIVGVGLWALMVLMLAIGLFMSAAFTRKFFLQAAAGLLLSLGALAAGALLADRHYYDDAQLNEELSDFAFGSAGVETKEVLDDRQKEIAKLASAAAARPPSALRDLDAFVEDSRHLGDSGEEVVNESVTQAAPATSVFADDGASPMNDLIDAIDQLLALPAGPTSADAFGQTLRAHVLSDGFTPSDELFRYTDEVFRLRRKLERLVPLYLAEDGDLSQAATTVMNEFNLNQLDSFYPLAAAEVQFSSRVFVDGEPIDTAMVESAEANGQTVDEIGTALVVAPGGPVEINGQFLPLVREFPLLAQGPQVEQLEMLDADFFTIAGLTSDVHLELARVALLSAQYPTLRDAAQDLRWQAFYSSATVAVMLALLLSAYGWLVVDPNRTSLHALYRDRVASSFLVGSDPKKPYELRIEPDHNLADIGRYELKSTAPYHLINCAVNLQASRELRTSGRNSDFFIFSKRFIGSEQTGFCRSSTMDKVMPEMSIQTAMAISGAAAAPNSGRSTSRALAAFMVFVNARLGQWIPNPGMLDAQHGTKRTPGYTVDDVIAEEQNDIARRWDNLNLDEKRSIDRGLLAVAFSGGGIRSASLNLGITQALEEAGVFPHIDYMSTVSGGGYLGAGISVGMRSVSPVRCPTSGTISVANEGTKQNVSIATNHDIHGPYEYPSSVALAVDDGQSVKAGERLVKARYATGDGADGAQAFSGGRGGEFGAQFYWRARPWTLLREMTGRLHEQGRSVNVSDGGHIENLATFELLRRKCRYIIVGDAEMDPDYAFEGLAILIRTARIELGADIDIDLTSLRPNNKGRTAAHFAVGTITYRGDAEPGVLLYLKSTITGSEPVDIAGYLAKNQAFPHQSTADQFFDEGQFESYRSLGYCIATDALASLPNRPAAFADIERWFTQLASDTNTETKGVGDTIDLTKENATVDA